MRCLITILLCVVISFGMTANSNAKPRNSEEKPDTGAVIKNLSIIIDDLEKQSEQLKNQCADSTLLRDKLSNRISEFTRNSKATTDDLEVYLEKLNFNTMLFDKEARDEVKNRLKNYPESDLRASYVTILEMQESLDKPYDETTNASFIKELTKVGKHVLKPHKEAFTKLSEYIKDYNFYMYELARLFQAMDDDGYRTSPAELVEDEDAGYLWEVPFTQKMLIIYKNKSGKLDDGEPEMLRKSCRDAFSDFNFK